jgi:hypothetical protein
MPFKAGGAWMRDSWHQDSVVQIYGVLEGVLHVIGYFASSHYPSKMVSIAARKGCSVSQPSFGSNLQQRQSNACQESTLRNVEV